MSEVLTLIYEAFGPSIRVVVDAVKTVTGEDGLTRTVTVVGGPPPPERHLTLSKLAEMDAKLEADLRSVLERLEPVIREKALADEADPVRVREEANRVAAERQKLEREKAEHSQVIDEAIVERKRFEIEIEALRKELSSLQAKGE